MADGKHFATPEGEEAEEKAGGIPRGAIVALAVVGALVVSYLGGALFFSRFFFPNTTLNGRDVSLSSCWAVADDIAQFTAAYELSVTGDGMDLTIPSTQIGIVTDADGISDSVMTQQNPWEWPTQLLASHELSYEPNATYDPNLLADVVTPVVEQLNTEVTASANAYVGYDEADNRFEIFDEVYGSGLDAAQIVEACGVAIADLEPSLVLDERYLTSPEVLKDDPRLRTQLDEANRILESNIELTMGGTSLTTVSGRDFARMVSVNPDDFTVGFDEEAFRSWAKDEFGEQYDTTGTERHYTRPDGAEIDVSGSRGTYGWVVDSAELTNQLISRLLAGANETLEVPTSQQGEVYAGRGVKDWGNSYVDVDLSDQYVRYYDEAGNLALETSCVSGDSNGHATPTGVFYIHDMERNTVLRGKIDPQTNKPEYESHVDYWMPFLAGDWGLHDASWRSSFGGSIYQGNGSHGCINLPVSAAADLYGMVHVGTPVVVHY